MVRWPSIATNSNREPSRRRTPPGQLLDVERVLTPGGSVRLAVRRGDDQQPVGREHALDLVEHPLLLLDVLDHLERHDGIERAVLERAQVARVAELRS